MALTPGARGRVGGVQLRLRAQPRVGHRAEVDLNERQQSTVLLVQESERCVRSERSLAHPVFEGLAGVALSVVAKTLEPGTASVREDSDVQLGQGGGVREEDRVGLPALPTTRDALPVHQAVRAACRPVMARSGTMLTVGASAPGESEVVQAAGAVAQRPLGDLGEQSPELILAHHAMRAQHIQQPPVDFGQYAGRAGGGGGTTSPDDTIAVAGARTTHGQKTWALADGLNTAQQASRHEEGRVESRARPVCPDFA